MHSIVRRFIKTGVGFLAAGLALGIWLLARRELTGEWPHPYLVSAHVHAVFVGFVMFMILGVALWLFPRPSKDDTRYRPEWIEASYWLLLVGTAGRFAGEIARASVGERWLGWVILGGGLAQAGGIALYLYTMWTRIRPVGSQVREAQGERF